ncbi:MAG: hypothetical protein LBB10_02965 [Bifidobacteriaceae bacterium]|jgi:ABC-type multidrug transport system permease subunit|nr:hypothetical protein [Bifidobacteriaceae bacterium]
MTENDEAKTASINRGNGVFKNRSKLFLTSIILAMLYMLFVIWYFGNSIGKSGTLGQAISTGIAVPFVQSQLFFFAIGVIFAWVGFVIKKAWGALVAAILYSIGTLLFLAYFWFSIPILVLGFVGFANQKKLKIKE